MWFLETFKIDWTLIELSSIDNWKIEVISLEEAISNKTKNIYFLSGVNSDLVYWQGIRAKDSDMQAKSYFCIDIDLRNNCKKEWIEITDDEIINHAWLIKDELESMKYFNEWRYIVYTWNWIHIYYVWDILEISVEDYSLWVERIYKKWDDIMWWLLKSDHACKNIARILRLPWTINQKNWQEVKILFEQDVKSYLVWNLFELASVSRKEIEIENKKKELEFNQRMKALNIDDNKFYEELNSSIPAYQIAELLIPECRYTWKKNFKNSKWQLAAYFYVQETNSICNWWSQHFLFTWTSKSCWNNFELIKKSKWFTNKETFAFFKDLFN